MTTLADVIERGTGGFLFHRGRERTGVARLRRVIPEAVAHSQFYLVSEERFDTEEIVACCRATGIGLLPSVISNVWEIVPRTEAQAMRFGFNPLDR